MFTLEHQRMLLERQQFMQRSRLELQVQQAEQMRRQEQEQQSYQIMPTMTAAAARGSPPFTASLPSTMQQFHHLQQQQQLSPTIAMSHQQPLQQSHPPHRYEQLQQQEQLQQRMMLAAQTDSSQQQQQGAAAAAALLAARAAAIQKERLYRQQELQALQMQVEMEQQQQQRQQWGYRQHQQLQEREQAELAARIMRRAQQGQQLSSSAHYPQGLPPALPQAAAGLLHPSLLASPSGMMSTTPMAMVGGTGGQVPREITTTSSSTNSSSGMLMSPNHNSNDYSSSSSNNFHQLNNNHMVASISPMTTSTIMTATPTRVAVSASTSTMSGTDALISEESLGSNHSNERNNTSPMQDCFRYSPRQGQGLSAAAGGPGPQGILTMTSLPRRMVSTDFHAAGFGAGGAAATASPAFSSPPLLPTTVAPAFASDIGAAVARLAPRPTSDAAAAAAALTLMEAAVAEQVDDILQQRQQRQEDARKEVGDDKSKSLPLPKMKQPRRVKKSTTTKHKVKKLPTKPKPPKMDTKWLAALEQLKEYKQVHGDCTIPRGYPLNPRLASWVAEQRKQYKLLQDGKRSSITPERIEQLNTIGFAWHAQLAAWDRRLKELMDFKQRYGHCHVPLNNVDPKLGLWVKEQRRHFALLKQDKPSHMTPKRAQILDDLGFCWDTHEATWLERLREVKAFRDQFGHCRIPTYLLSNPKLSTWANHQRRQYTKFQEGQPCHITQERIDALDEIGFSWRRRKRGRKQNKSNEKNHADGDPVYSDDDDDVSTSGSTGYDNDDDDASLSVASHDSSRGSALG